MSNTNHRLYGVMYADANDDVVYNFSCEDDVEEYLQGNTLQYGDWLVLMNRMSLSDDFIKKNLDNINDCGLYTIVKWQSVGCDVLELMAKRIGDSEHFWSDVKQHQTITYAFWRKHIDKLLFNE